MNNIESLRESCLLDRLLGCREDQESVSDEDDEKTVELPDPRDSVPQIPTLPLQEKPVPELGGRAARMLEDLPTVLQLVEEYKQAWNGNSQTFQDIVLRRPNPKQTVGFLDSGDVHYTPPFSGGSRTLVCEAEFVAKRIQRFDDILTTHLETFCDPAVDYKANYGFVDRVTFPETATVFVRADIHGSLKALLQNLDQLKADGHLDEKYNCKPGVHLLFLGDYIDRGPYPFEVLELLAMLQLKNPRQVFLIRGNHEDVTMNDAWLRDWYGFAQSEDNNLPDLKETLENFFETMPLALFFGQRNPDGHTEYVMATHGLFEPHIDLTPLVDAPDDRRAVIPFTTEESYGLSRRVYDLAAPQDNLVDAPPPLQVRLTRQRKAAERIAEIVADGFPVLRQELDEIEFDSSLPEGFIPLSASTSFMWGDVKAADPLGTHKGGGRRAGEWVFEAEDVSEYLALLGDQNKVSTMLRGHQHKDSEVVDKKTQKVVARTLPIANHLEVPAYIEYFSIDRMLLLTTASQVDAWQCREVMWNELDHTTEGLPPYAMTTPHCVEEPALAAEEPKQQPDLTCDEELVDGLGD